MICQNCGQDFNGPNCPKCGAPANMGPAMPAGAVVVEKRSIATCIVLTIVTLGIYGLYWMVKVHQEVHIVSGEQPTVSGGMLILLTIVTFGIYSLYWCYKQGERIDKIHTMRGVPVGNNAVLYLVISIVGFSIVAMALMQNELNTYA